MIHFIRSSDSFLEVSVIDARIKKAAKFGLNIASEIVSIRSKELHQRAAPICMDAIRRKSDCVLYRWFKDSSLPRYSILVLPLSLRSLFSLLDALLNQTIPGRLEIARSSADFIAGRLFVSCLGFIRLDKGSPAEKLREETRRQRRVTAAINDRAASQQSLLDLRATDTLSRARRQKLFSQIGWSSSKHGKAS